MRVREIGVVREKGKFCGFVASRTGIGRNNPCVAVLCCQPRYFNHCDAGTHPCDYWSFPVRIMRLVKFEEDREKDNFSMVRAAVPSFG